MTSPHSIELLEARIAPAFAAVIDIGALDGNSGFALEGAGQSDGAGMSVSGAGDVNGDGFEDVIVGAPGADPTSNASGASYVVFGKAGGFAATMSLSMLNGSNGFRLNGVGEIDLSGRSVSGAGDINGDGFDDVLIGAMRSDAGGAESGASYVVFGKASGFAPSFNLSSLNGSNGFRIPGEPTGNYSGYSVSGAGDVNGDGFADLIIGTPRAANGGAAYVVFGKAAGWTSSFNLTSLNGSNGFKVTNANVRDGLGRSVSDAGDVNGDGFDDVVIGDYTEPPGTGAVVVIFGKPAGFTATLNVSALNGSNGFRLVGTAGDNAGTSVSEAGDVNADGFDDLIIGGFLADRNGKTDSGVAYVVFGKASGFAPVGNLGSLNGSNGFQIPGVASADYLGFAVGGAGDINADGFDDMIVGAPAVPSDGAGASYVILGKADGFTPTVNLLELNGENGFAVHAAAPSDYFGYSVSGAGDVNQDGFDDLIFGANGADPAGRAEAGASYVLFGAPTATVAISNASIVEGDANTTELTFTASLSAKSTVPVTVRYSTHDVTAVAGSDFLGVTNELLTIAPGETSKAITIKVNGETTYEADETFTIALSDPRNATLRDPAAPGIGTILNDDAPPLVSIAGGSAPEGNSGASSVLFTVSLSEASGLPVTVRYASADGTALARADYGALAPGTLTFAPGETTKTIAVAAFGDVSIEDHETFSVMLSDALGATIGTGTANGTILNDDTALLIATTFQRLEGDSGTTPFEFTVSLEKPSALPVTVNYETFIGDATPGTDFVEPPEDAQIAFAPGEVTKTITIDVLGDTSIEDDDSFGVLLSGAINARWVNDRARTVILNDDTALRIAAPPADLEGDSGASPFVFTISLEQRSAIPVTVSYETADGTATAGSDYEAIAPTQLTFAAGEMSKTITVNVLGEAEGEAHETFSVVLSGASGATIAEGTATGTILNDDTLVRIADAALLEGHSGTRAMSFTVSLTAPSAETVSVDFASTDGTARSGADYAALTPGRLEFAPGETTKTLLVEVLGDMLVEGNETLSIVLANATAAAIEDGTGVGTILDDDVTIVGPRKATFTDADGELVSIKVSKGTLKVEDFTLVPTGLGAQLALVDFSGEAEFAGTKLSISAKAPRGVAGDGFAHVGYIDTTGIDLGKVKVKGDLGQIDAGDGLDAKPGLKSLSAQSMGASGLLTQLPGGSLESDIAGALGALKLKDGMHDATLSVSGDLDAVKITGDVRDSAIRSDGQIGAISISGDLSANAEGIATISARGMLAPASIAKALAIGSITIGGSVERAQLLAGYDRAGAAVHGDAGIGPVFVGANWTASSLAAGARAGEDGMFGTTDDSVISPNGAIVAKIASIVIKGSAAGTASDGDHFGFVAEEIGFLKAGGVKIPLAHGPGNDLAGQPVGATGDLRARELA